MYKLINRKFLQNAARSCAKCTSKSVHFTGKRFQSTSPLRADANGSTGPGFKKLIVLGLVGSAIFVKAAESVERSKHQNSFSENDYNTYVMNGLKRKQLMFAPGSIPPVKFCLGDATKEAADSNTLVVDPVLVVDYFRLNEASKYEALLNEIFIKWDSNREVLPTKLPQGMICMLIGRYLQDHMKMDPEIATKKQIVIKNFPHNLKEAMKFENDVANVEALVADEDVAAAKNEIVDYYKTVNKVETET